jgi:hypothetical protein
MSDEIGTYSFLPWLRLGLANAIDAVDGNPGVTLRASVPVALTVTGRAIDGGADLEETVSRQVALYGPGDILRIEHSNIVKVEPRDGFANFEPNYFPHIEFYDEDFPWRYTPAAPDHAKHRLRPWLALIVLAKGEFEAGDGVRTGPLDTVTLTALPDDVFPPADQLWAWAHVHINKDIIKNGDAIISSDMAAVMDRFQSTVGANPDHAYSRLICPRRLEPNIEYHAFLMPTFESGRLAGLGFDETPPNPALFATMSAWASYNGRPQPAIYPYYHRWSFNTGKTGDFESLVRLLKPRPPDHRLGRRDVDVLEPGANIAGIDIPGLDGVLRLEGALKVPAEALSDAQEAEAAKFENWDNPYPHPFQEQLAAFINLADEYQKKLPADANADAVALPAEVRDDPDPLITPPLYGRWHALTDRLLTDADGSPAPQRQNWVHELNLDPRWRVAAGFGTDVVQNKQEEFMDAAWGQVGAIIEANRRIRYAQLAREASWIWYHRHLVPIEAANTERGLYLTAPVHRRVIAGGLTIRHTIAESIVPSAAIAPEMRRLIRPRDHVAGALGFDTPAATVNLIDRLNEGEVTAAPPKVTPEAVPTVEGTTAALEPEGVPKGWLACLRARPRLRWVLPLLLLLLALIVLPFSRIAAGVLVVLAIAVFVFLAWLLRALAKADSLGPAGSSPEAIDALPSFPGFTVVDPVIGGAVPADPAPGGADSLEATAFKSALKEVHLLLTESEKLGRKPKRPKIDVAGLTNAVIAAINPLKTIPRFTFEGMHIPGRLIAQFTETFVEAMAYPEIDSPMYKPLTEPTVERFLPGIKHLPQNTITLLETNQRFIEAYMVGLNHEFARELLWREYPTDQRGSYFRQFWDASGVQNPGGLSREELREKLRDIPPLHLWSKFSRLGDHDHREKPGDNEEEVVLVIRGELLKRYPTAVIYAHRAKWQTIDGVIDPEQERIPETEGNMADNIKMPLYEAEASPDVYFRGFDLTAKVAKGGSGIDGDNDPGWFFIIKERPGEPRFGFDEAREGPLNVWNDLSWADVKTPADGNFLRIDAGTPTHVLVDPVAPELQEKKDQYAEDKALTWHAGTNAAELAYILYQAPVLVAVHGSVMLPQ